MIDLENTSGLPIKYDEKTHVLLLGDGIKQILPDVRVLREMIPVLMNGGITSPEKWYYMYRDVHKIEHEQLIRANNLRYDLTVMLPGLAGNEYIKTFGHFHPKIPGSDNSYPETYSVLHGIAHFILQRGVEPVEDFIVVSAKAGEHVVILPGYGHVMINIGHEPLVLANWVSSRYTSDYMPIKNKVGMAYYETPTGFIKNKNYNQVSDIKFMVPNRVLNFGLTKRPMYTEAIENIKKLDYLNNPQDYLEEFFDSLK